MSKFKKILALVCALSMVVGLFAGCDENKPDDTTGTSGGTTAPVVPGQTTSYIVNLKSAGGLPLSDVTLLVYADEALTNLQGYGQTDENGQAVIRMPGAEAYYLVVSDAPDGYVTETSYKMTAAILDVTLTSQVIADPSLSGVTYELGDVMHDFTVTDTDGNEVTLSKLLEEKDMVLLNFWFSTCSPCISEFPYMDSVYQRYSDDVAVVALNHYASDTADMVNDFKNHFYDVYDTNPETTDGLSFTMAKEDLGMQSAFANMIGGYPTSVVVDRYGVICLVEVGGLVSEEPFTYMFDAFIGDDYTQTLYENGVSDLVPEVRPNVEMPAVEDIAAVMNGGEIDVVYSAETDPDSAEMTWPFIIGQKDGVDCIYASNAGVAGSYATLYANVTLKAGQAVALDYFASSESGVDSLYVLVDRNDIYQISGESTGWNTCYPWVALEDGEYEIALCYIKDGADDVGDDTVYLKNLRVVDQSEVDVASYIPRYAATNPRDDGFGYDTYITPVFNEKDGYYHVNSENGPLLLANLMMATQFSNDPIYTLAANGQIVIDGVDYYEDIVGYCSYASNSQIYSMVPVNEELKSLLQTVAAAVGIEQTENEWLQICEYYDAYGTGGTQLADPIKGLSADSAYTAQVGTNSVTYDRMIMPRGLLYKFVPTKSGAYRITSSSEFEVEGWVFTRENLENREAFYTYEAGERMYYSQTDISMVVYMEAGKEYFIDIAYYDVYQVGTFTFEIEYEGGQMELFTAASPGYFTYYDETTYDVVAGGIEVALGDDGYYHELLSDGSLGSIVYADFIGLTSIFSHSLNQMIESRAFNFALSEIDQEILDYYDYYEALDFNGTDFETCMAEVWGEDVEYYWEYYQVDDVLDGIYHGRGEDMTAIAQKYSKKAYGSGSGEKEGCVAVTEELAQVLQMLMDKYTFRDVEHSWTKVCYYYDYIGPDPNK